MSSLFYNYSNDFIALEEDPEPSTMKLDDQAVGRFKVAKEFNENKARINSIDFSQDGKSLITSSDDESIKVYDCEKGNQKREIMSKKYGVDLIKYTHASNTAIHTSTKGIDTIRYLSLHDNKYLRYFVGHEKRVVTLCMSPADDSFISGSLDQSIRLWDLRSEKSTGRILLPSAPIVNYDPEGLIYAVGLNSEVIKLFDARNYDKGPFNTIKCVRPINSNITWKSLKFSPNGKQILITSDMEQLFILDAFTGQPLNILRINEDKIPQTPIEHPCEGSYTPDAQFVICGGIDGSVHVWSAEGEAKKTHVLVPARSSPDPVQCVMFNPKYMLLASACSRISFWIPSRTTKDLNSN